ncbi:hypothetical protein [Aureibaculum luteum]|uniref:hypothetical protein n=1 Tax=Aureibaculum luteum TaxID=1548456 RepID=UPI0013009EEC|nr:hypothetical protein [Aureibaculum luteum]
MKTSKIITIIIMIFCMMPSSAQNTLETTLIQTINTNKKNLNQLKKALEYEEKFLTELLNLEGDNSILIKKKTSDRDKVKKEILKLKASLFELSEQLKKEVAINNESKITNKDIIPLTLQSDDKYWFNQDIRNPISFTEFIIRNPRTNGTDKLTKPSNLSSYHYIKPGSIINILFKKDVYNKLKETDITIKAYLKRVDGTVVPIDVSGYFDVKLDTNQEEFEKNIAESYQDGLEYNYKVNPTIRGPIQSEVNSSIANPQPQDKLIITVINSSDGNVSFTTTFEFEDFGWETTPSGGFSWVNTINQNNANFRPAGSSGVSFHYKLNKGSKFITNFINPSFGPELIVMQGANEDTLIGLGLSVSTFMRTVKFGYGWYLVGENGKPYFSIGVNFIEGYKSISSILSRSQD